MSAAEDVLAMQLRASNIAHEREYRFAAPRKWRADIYVKPDLLVEVEGGVYVNGRHNRASGFLLDLEKYNAATILDYRLIRVTPQMVHSGEALALIERALA